MSRRRLDLLFKQLVVVPKQSNSQHHLAQHQNTEFLDDLVKLDEFLQEDLNDDQLNSLECQIQHNLERNPTSAWLYASSVVKTYWKLKWIEDIPGYGVANLFEDQVDNTPKRIAIFFENFSMTYNEVNVLANRISIFKILSNFLELICFDFFSLGHWGRRNNLQVGDVVALMMDNRPEFIITWLGLCKLGVITAFINFRLHGASLKHVIDICQAKMYILGERHFFFSSVDSFESRF